MNELNQLLRTLLFLPPQASTVARQIDTLHYWVIGSTFAGAIGITLVGGYFLFRYRRGLGEEPPRQEGGPRPSGPIEASVIIGLFALFILFWFIGNAQFTRLRVPPPNARPIYVSAKQWMWKFAYPEGARSISVLYVPAGQPIKLILSARDVIHSFYVPDFRVKEDAVPGLTTTLWFEAPEPGTHQILCAEYCGVGHSVMRGQVVVLSPVDYARWLDGAPASALANAQPYNDEPPPGEYVEPAVIDDFAPRQGTNLVKLGERVAAEHGCLRCHTTDGSAYIAPTWAGLFRSRVALADGQSVIADEAYLTESMMEPTVKQVSGFPLVMPSYRGLLKPGETAAILELIRSLKDAVPRPANTPLEPPPLTPDGRAPAPVRRVP